MKKDNNVKHVKLTGRTPLLMHWDNLAFGPKIAAWRSNPMNKGLQIPGDDRSPSWTWVGYVYHHGRVVGIPSDNLMTMMREGGVLCPSGKGKGTLKKISQSGLVVIDPIWPIVTANGKRIDYCNIEKMYDVDDFDKHHDMVADMGFELSIKRAKIGAAKHVRVRPMFHTGWTIEGDIMILDSAITLQNLTDILFMGGTKCGLGDWRTSSPKSPGSYGMFDVEIS